MFIKKDIDNICEENELDEKLIFQQDNEAYHTSYSSEVAINILFGENVTEWPPNSQDLSPIENVWANNKGKIIQKNNTKSRWLKSKYIRYMDKNSLY